MKKITSFLTRVLPLTSTIIVLSLAASIANADYVSCGAEQSSGTSYYPSYYTTSNPPYCYDIYATVYAYKDCIDQYGNACRISWDENYLVHYYFSSPAYCNLSGGTWTSNTNIVDTCQ
jgi:hypothetical protein